MIVSESDFELICEVLQVVAAECEYASNMSPSVIASYANRDYSKRCKDVLARFKNAYAEAL